MRFLCGFVVFTTGRFVLSHALLFVLVFSSIPFCIMVSSLGKERVRVCYYRAVIIIIIIFFFYFFFFFFCTRQFLSFFSCSWCQGLASACNCGTPWIFLLSLLQDITQVLYELISISPLRVELSYLL